MSDILQKRLTRRDLLKGAAALASIAALATVTTNTAIAGAPKAAMGYRDTPNGEKSCSNCSLFAPGGSASSKGTCKVVDGAINPTGYCMAYTVKA